MSTSANDRFAEAHEAWAIEARRSLGGSPYVHLGKRSAMGETGSRLRRAREAREAAFAS